MGCGASAAPSSYEPAPPEPEPCARPQAEAQQVEVATGGDAGFVVAAEPVYAAEGDPRRPKKQNFLPFVRYDTAAVPKEIRGGDHVYVVFTYSEAAFEGMGEGVVAAASTDLTGSCVFRCWRKDETNHTLNDGDEIFLEHVETGMFLEAATDSKPLALANKDLNSAGQLFGLFKQGRPLAVRHRDTVYLQSWLHNYVEEKYFEGTDLYAKRWQRRQPQTMTILKKAVLDSSTTETARRFQFQAFDLDGNGSISKAEMDHMIHMVKNDASPEEIDEIMAQADPAHTGNIPFQAFASWADGGGLPEEKLHHVEVLGNIAQRCNDALDDDNALIEVLTTINDKDTQAMVAKYGSELGAGSITKEIDKKTSEQDGWIFSNNWKAAMAALLEPEVDLWVRCLNDAMRGWGTDEGTLTALVCTMPERLRVPIFQAYHTKTGKHLLDHIQSETSCSYQKVLVWQAMAPEDCRATILNRAMKGLGTSEDQLIRVICALDFGERRQVKEAYERLFSRNLIEHIESETSGDFKKSLKCMLEAAEAEFDLDADCESMKEAMEGWGTDEEKLIQMICNKTSKQMEDVNARFQELYDRDLLGWVRSETSGHFKDTLTGCIRHPMVQLAHSVRDCIKGWGTDDTGLITCLVHLEDFKKAALIKTYAMEFKGRDLIKDIKSDTSGNYEKALCCLVKPAPVVWAEALTGAMKGLGTSDKLLINFMVLARDDMQDVRKAFFAKNGKKLEDWIDGDCGAEDYKKTLLELAGRNSEDEIDIMPLYWAQRTLDAIRNIDTIKEVLVSMPAVSIKRHLALYEKVYGGSLREMISKKCEEGRSWFSFSNYWKTTMLSLLDLPVERYVKGLWDAMHGWGTDEFTLTGLVCTLPENLYQDIHQMYQKDHGRTFVDHIESETSFCYKKVLMYQAMSWPESRATALHGAMAGWGTAEDQLIRVIVCSTMKERALIREAYQAKYGKNLIKHVESETSGSFKNCLVAVLKSTHPRVRIDYDADCEQIKAAMDGIGTDEKAIIKIVAGKTPQQIETLKAKFMEKYEEDLYERLDSETWDWGASIFTGANFRACVLGLVRKPIEALACAVRDCIVGFGTDDTGLITLLVHLSERRRRDLVAAYAEVRNGGDLYQHIKGDTSGNYERALLALVKPPPRVWAEALHGAMKGLGTSDNLLINWMCISKDRMDEVRDAFQELYGQDLARWIDGDCSGDYKDTLVRLANRRCLRFAGTEVGLSISPPATREDAVLCFTKAFNRLCRERKEAGESIVPKEDAQQELGCTFLYFGSLSSCAPNLDMPGLWELTNAVGFPPADDGPDLIATFHEWNYSGSGEISWNDFVREMATRVNDPGHFEADPLPETLDQLETMAVHRAAPRPAEECEPEESEPEPEEPQNGTRGGGNTCSASGLFVDELARDGMTWRDILQIEEPCEEDGMLGGAWGECIRCAVAAEHSGGFGGACGQVLEYLAEMGHDAWMGAADQREQACHAEFD